MICGKVSQLGAKVTANASNIPGFIAGTAGNTIDLSYTKGVTKTNVTVAGARGGVQYPLQGQTPISYANLGNEHVVVYGPDGRHCMMCLALGLRWLNGTRRRMDHIFPRSGMTQKPLREVFLSRFLIV